MTEPRSPILQGTLDLMVNRERISGVIARVLRPETRR